MMDMSLQPATPPAACITRRTILAFGLITLSSPVDPTPENLYSNLRVLGSMRIDEETRAIPLLSSEEHS